MTNPAPAGSPATEYAVVAPKAQAPKLIELDGLRGWLAWWVVVGHFLKESGWKADFTPTLGKLLLDPGVAVKLFIILSGFVITLLLARQERSYRDFIIPRAFRIFPLYYVMLVVGLLSLPWLIDFYPGYLAKLGDPQDLHNLHESWIVHNDHRFTYLAVCLTGLHGAIPVSWLPHAQSAFVSQAWSISLEWQFYLVAPFLWKLLRSRSGLLFIALALYATFGLRHFFKIGDWTSFLPQNLEFFLLGSVSYLAYTHLRLGTARGVYARALFSVICLAIGFIPFFPAVIFTPWPWTNIVNESLAVGVWFVVLTLAIARRHEADHPFVRWVSYIFTNPVVLFLGRISYSTYLCHYFVIFGLQWAMLTHAPLQISKLNMALCFLTAGTALVVMFSVFLHRFVEIPGIALGKKLSAN